MSQRALSSHCAPDRQSRSAIRSKLPTRTDEADDRKTIPEFASHPSAAAFLADAMTDLPAYESSVAAGAFCLTQMLRAIPARAGLVHLLDPRTNEFVCVYGAGSCAEHVLTSTMAIDDWMIEAAVMRELPLAMEYEGAASAQPRPRHRVFEPWSVLVAPVVLHGRCVAVIELVDPLDGSSFSPGDVHAASLVTARYAEFLGEQTLVSPAVIPSGLAEDALVPAD